MVFGGYCCMLVRQSACVRRSGPSGIGTEPYIHDTKILCYWLLAFGGLGYLGTSLTWMMVLVYFLVGYEGESRVHYCEYIARGCLGNGEVGTKIDNFTLCWWRLLCMDGCLYCIVLLVNVNTHI